MIISKVALGFITFMIIFSVFVANVANLINVDLTFASSEHNNSYYNAWKEKNKTISDSTDHLVWFLQISDIHISKFQDRSRITELREFCELTVPAINPKVVLASGDLTDAKTKDHIGSRQYEDEWKYYSAVLQDCRISEKTKWLDIRGNHDNFNVASINSKENYFLNYSMQGKYHSKSYMHQERIGDDVYSFIAVDACLDPGPRRPFNFVGILNNVEIQNIRSLVQKARDKGSEYIVWFGHFPTSCILTPGSGGVRNILGQYPEGLVYMCGHLHTLGGLVTNMYTLQKAGFLELELGDWKDNRIFRLAAIDHGLLSFVDSRHGDWPLVLITNPKHALYTIPNREPSQFIAHSTHIRILAFSVSNITNVSVKINDNDWQECVHVNGPLYVSNWDPSLYATGLHTLHVNVKDEQGRDKTISQPFTLDNSRLKFGMLARIALMTDASTVFQICFGAFMLVCIIPLCLLRYMHKLVKERKIKKPFIKNRCLRTWTRKLWSLVTVDRIFYPLVLYPVYLCLGPWSAGYIIEEHFGVIFAWGIFVRGAYLPGSFTYAYGFLQLFTFQIPFTFILANCIDHRICCQLDRTKKHRKWLRVVWFNMAFILVITVQIVFAYFFWLAYGTVAFLLGPLRTWTIVYAVVMWWQALHLPENCTREATDLWFTKMKIDSTDDEQHTENIT
ncbi:hypothetical protein CBL_10916 [Carabus blaptoides fortunei]